MSKSKSVPKNSTLVESVNIDGSSKSDQLTTGDKAKIVSIADVMVNGGRMFKEAYMGILALIGFDIKALIDQLAEYFQPRKYRFDNVMHQWGSDYESRLNKMFRDDGFAPNVARDKAENKVKNDKAAMMAWFRDETNIGIPFLKPSESADDATLDLSSLTAKQLKNHKLKVDAKELRETTTELVKLLRDIVNTVINNDKARANDNKAEIDAEADKALRIVSKAIMAYHNDVKLPTKKTEA